MKFTLVVATSSQRVVDFVSARKSAAIPLDNRKAFQRDGITLSIVSFLIEGEGFTQAAETFLANMMERSDGIILLCDLSVLDSARQFCEAAFVAGFDGQAIGNSVQNEFFPIVARALRNFKIYFRTFSDFKFKKLLMLPLKNFKAAPLKEIQFLFAHGALSEKFSKTLFDNLKALHERRSPKNGVKQEEAFLLDDCSHFYQYGKERHSRPETGVPPHKVLCKMTANFRFGLKLEVERHFNVSTDSRKISGRFFDCHGADIDIGSRSHLNMFPNGYF